MFGVTLKRGAAQRSATVAAMLVAVSGLAAADLQAQQAQQRQGGAQPAQGGAAQPAQRGTIQPGQREPGGGAAQQGAAAREVPRTGRASAPFDMTGNWVSLITEDWQYRMITPPRGDVSHIPLNAEGRRVAEQWDPARDEAAGEACKAYAAPAIMRLPSRLRISWENENTMKIEIDTGTQTRLFHFDRSVQPGERSWQGHSVAEWRREGSPGNGSLTRYPFSASLKVDTNNLRPGYLRKNGVPFSERAYMTEYFNLLTEENGDQYLAIQTFVADPVYLQSHWVRTLIFKKERDGSRFKPEPCVADGWPVTTAAARR